MDESKDLKDDISSIPATTDADADDSSGGLVTSASKTIRSFLTSACSDHVLPQDLRDLSSSISKHSFVSYKSLRSIWIASDPSERPELFSLLSGWHFIFSSPKPRSKSEELQARLRRLVDLSQRKEYKD